MADTNETTQAEDEATKAPPRKKAAASRPRTRKAASGSRPPAKKSASGTSRPAAKKKFGAVAIARTAKEQLTELLNKNSETVIGVQRTDDGWQVDLEVVETERIPDTTDVLAIYRVQLDEDGDVEAYQRLDRYIRGKTEGGIA